TSSGRHYGRSPRPALISWSEYPRISAHSAQRFAHSGHRCLSTAQFSPLAAYLGIRIFEAILWQTCVRAFVARSLPKVAISQAQINSIAEARFTLFAKETTTMNARFRTMIATAVLAGFTIVAVPA